MLYNRMLIFSFLFSTTFTAENLNVYLIYVNLFVFILLPDYVVILRHTEIQRGGRN